MRFYPPNFIKRVVIQVFLFVLITLLGLSTLNWINRLSPPSRELSRRSRIEELSRYHDSAPGVTKSSTTNSRSSEVGIVANNTTPQVQAVVVSIEKGNDQKITQHHVINLPKNLTKILPLDFKSPNFLAQNQETDREEFFTAVHNQVEHNRVTNDQEGDPENVQHARTAQGEGEIDGAVIAVQGQTEDETIPVTAENGGVKMVQGHQIATEQDLEPEELKDQYMFSFDTNISDRSQALYSNKLENFSTLIFQNKLTLENPSYKLGVETEGQIVQHQPIITVPLEMNFSAVEGLPEYVVEAIPTKIRELFPFEAVYDFDMENKERTDEQQANKRIKRLREFCASPLSKKAGFRNVNNNKAVILYERFNTLECSMAKTGTTSRGKIFWPLHHNKSDPFRHPHFDELVPKRTLMDVIHTPQNYSAYSIRFMFTRSPLNRALSGYFNKVVQTGYLDGPNMLMGKFFQSLASYSTSDVHFVDQLSICRPCELGLSFLARSETYSADMNFIINYLTSLHQKIDYKLSPNFHGQNFYDLKKFQTLTLGDVFDFIWSYRYDYLAFGYSPYSDIRTFLSFKA